jgi:hypothetical protein
VAQLTPVRSANQVILPFLQTATPIFFFIVGVIISILYVWTRCVCGSFSSGPMPGAKAPRPLFRRRLPRPYQRQAPNQKRRSCLNDP